MFKSLEMFKILLLYSRGFNFIKTVYELFNSFTILERDMMSIFPKRVKNVRLQTLSDSVKFCRRLMQKILDLLSYDLTTSKDIYRAESAR